MPFDKSLGDAKDAADSEDRRRFLKYLSATGAVAGMAGCTDSGGSTATDTASATDAKTTSDPLENTDTETDAKDTLQRGGTFIIGSDTTTNGLNAFRIGDGETSDRVAQVMDGGFIRKGEAYDDILPMWFEDFEASDDLTEFTITLRDNLKYGEGYGKLTADDYIWNIENLWTADWASFTYNYLFYTGKDDTPIEFEAPDKHTIKMSIPEPRPFFPYNEPLAGMYPLPKELAKPYVEKEDAEGLAKDEEVMRSTFNGNLGPWDLKRWSQQSVMEFERAEDYYLRKWAKEDDRVPNAYAEAPFFDEYHIQYYDKMSTARQSLKAGEIDRAYIPSTKVPNYKDKDDLSLYKNPYRSWSGYLGINHRANGWDQLRNKKVRHAMAHVYHNDFIVKNILNGRASTQDSLHPKWGPYYPDDPVTFDGSIEKAKKLLKEGTSSDYGYSNGKLVGPDGEQVELKLVYVSDETDNLRAAYLKKRLDKVGIKLKQETTSWTSLLANYFRTNNPAEGVSKDNIGYGDDNSHPSTYNYGPQDKAVSKKSWDFMLTLGFSYGPLTPAGTIASLFGEQESFNAYGFEPDKDLVAMREEARTAESIDAARSTISEMLKYLSEERPVIFEYNPHNHYAYRKRVEGEPESPAASYFVDQNHDLMGFTDGKSGR
jgi:peptide/nickel transport system substrate-binding protein